MSRDGPGMVDVELLDVTSAEGGRTGGPDAPEDPATRRRRWRAAAIVVGVGLAVLAAATVRGDALLGRDDARVSALADVPGFASTLREPLAERWTTTGFVSAVGDVVLTHQAADGLRRTVVRETATGDLRWVQPEPVVGEGRPLCSARVVDARGRALLVCELAGVGGQTAPNTDAVLGRTPDRLLMIDAADGTVRAVWDLDHRTVGWAVLDDDVVIARRDGPAVRVERTEVVSADPVWAAELALGLGSEVLVRELTLSVSDGFAVVTGPSAGVVDGTDGTVLGTWSAPAGADLPVRVQTSTIGFLVWPSSGAGVWCDRAGAPGANVPGEPVPTALADGSASQVVLVASPTGLGAVDVRGVGPLWEAAPTERVLVRVDGLAVLQDEAALRVVDVRTGEELWSVRVDADVVSGLAPVTDGVRLLVPSSGTGTGAGRLTAYDLRDGSAQWTAPLPGGSGSVAVLGDGSVGVHQTGRFAVLG